VTPTGLFIKDVTLDDGGDYSCRAMQTNSMVTDFKEIPIKLIIQRKYLLSDAVGCQGESFVAAIDCNR
jgi:hypothetical protein